MTKKTFIIIFILLYFRILLDMLRHIYHALIQTDFHIGDRFWSHKNRHTKNLKQSFFVYNYI